MTEGEASERALEAAEEIVEVCVVKARASIWPLTCNTMAVIIDRHFPAGDRRKGERRKGSSSEADKDHCLADGSYRRKSERRKNTTEQVRKLREALEWALVRCESGMLCCWFCSQQLPDRPQHDENCPYAQARTALAESEAGKTEQVPQVKQSPDPMGLFSMRSFMAFVVGAT